MGKRAQSPDDSAAMDLCCDVTDISRLECQAYLRNVMVIMPFAPASQGKSEAKRVI